MSVIRRLEFVELIADSVGVGREEGAEIFSQWEIRICINGLITGLEKVNSMFPRLGAEG